MQSLKQRIGVMVVDDSAVVRQVMADVLGADPGIEVIATAGAGPWRMRGVCGVIATARKGDGRGAAAPASQVSQVASQRLSQPSRVPFTSGVPLSM